jgi:hypothetical protein
MVKDEKKSKKNRRFIKHGEVWRMQCLIVVIGKRKADPSRKFKVEEVGGSMHQQSRET